MCDRCKTITDFSAIKCMAAVLSEIDVAEYVRIAEYVRTAATSATDFLLTAMADGSENESEAMMVIRALHRMQVGDQDVQDTIKRIVDVVTLVANGKALDVKHHDEFKRALTFFSLLSVPLSILDMVKEADAPSWVGFNVNKQKPN